MKSSQFFLMILIATGAVTGAAIATVTYLNDRQILAQQNLPFLSYPRNLTLNQRQTNQQPLRQNTRDFEQFRQRLLEAIARRNANFIRALVTPQTEWNKSGNTNIDTLKIDNPQSSLWEELEKAVEAGCTAEPNAKVSEKDPNSEVFVCPQTRGRLIYDFGWKSQVGILAKRVNIRAKPTTEAEIVAVITQELLQFDDDTFSNSSQLVKEEIIAPEGWTPVILSNGKRGWIQNRFVYYEPRDYRVSFVLSRGQWRLRYILKGDGS
jgi:hypothetical protein